MMISKKQKTLSVVLKGATVERKKEREREKGGEERRGEERREVYRVE